MNFHVMTLFPEMVMNGLNTSILGRAASNGLLSFEAINIRDYTLERHGQGGRLPLRRRRRNGHAGGAHLPTPMTALCDRIGKQAPGGLYDAPGTDL